jgi:hypothetical protein
MRTTNEVELMLDLTHYSLLGLVRKVNFLLQDAADLLLFPQHK